MSHTHMVTSKSPPSSRVPPVLRKEISPPDDVLRAAEAAPRVFHIAAYYTPIWVMREKGHSWRAIATWLEQFHIEVSYVHLRRLFVQENRRLARLTRKELRALRMPEKMIDEIFEKTDPTERLPAADAGDEDDDDEETSP
jgi:hypothetical protein